MSTTEVVILFLIPVITLVICVVDTQTWIDIVKSKSSK